MLTESEVQKMSYLSTTTETAEIVQKISFTQTVEEEKLSLKIFFSYLGESLLFWKFLHKKGISFAFKILIEASIIANFNGQTEGDCDTKPLPET